MSGYRATVTVYEKFTGYIVRLCIETPNFSPKTTEVWYGTKLFAMWKARRVRKSFRRAGWIVG